MIKTIRDSDVAQWFPPRTNGRDVNKGTFGHTLVIGGSPGMLGSAILAAEAAARSGSGLVTLAVPRDLQGQVVSRVSPFVMTRGLNQNSQGTFNFSAAGEALLISEKINALALGPGIGSGDDVAAFVFAMIKDCPFSIVLDADALNLIALLPDRGQSLIRNRRAQTILTPHPAEMGRLLGVETENVQADRTAAVLQAAKIYQCIAVLKGANTLVANSFGEISMNPTGNPGMSTGGSGDVLTGIIAGLIAQRLDEFHAAQVGPFIHGRAGDLFEKEIGGCTGMVATDLIDELPKAIASARLVGSQSGLNLL